jgi:hypothetical protein
MAEDVRPLTPAEVLDIQKNQGVYIRATVIHGINKLLEMGIRLSRSTVRRAGKSSRAVLCTAMCSRSRNEGRMAEQSKSYGFRAGWLGAINADGDVIPLRSFSVEVPLAWTVVSGFSVSAWRMFSRKVQHNIARREARARRREAKRG